MHRDYIGAAERGDDGLAGLPTPFETIIPNAAAIAMACEADQTPHSFSSKYTSPFAKRLRNLCDEIVDRSQSIESSRSRAVADRGRLHRSAAG